MKNNSLNKGIEAIKKVRLSPEEKGRVLSRLITYADAHPVLPSPLSKRFSVVSLFLAPLESPLQFRFGYVLAGSLLLIVTGGGAAFAAEGALPGDPLYPIKIYVNEPVRGSFALGKTQKAEWEAAKAVRRLEEAETLSSEGRLSTTTALAIKADFDESAEALHTIVRDSQATGTSTEMGRIQTDFESEVHMHAHALALFTEDTQPEQLRVQKVEEEAVPRADLSEEQKLSPKEVIRKTRTPLREGHNEEHETVFAATTTAPVATTTTSVASTTPPQEERHDSATSTQPIRETHEEVEPRESERATSTAPTTTSTQPVATATSSEKTQETRTASSTREVEPRERD